MGQGNAVALTADGLPYVAYFGYPGGARRRRDRGPTAVRRRPSVPGVMLATGSTRGHVAARGGRHEQAEARPTAGVRDPVRTGGDARPRPDDGQQQRHGDRRADDGTVHVAWTMGGAVYSRARPSWAAPRRSTRSSTWARRSTRPGRSGGRASRWTATAPLDRVHRGNEQGPGRARRRISPAPSGSTRSPRPRVRATAARRRSPPGSGSSAAPRLVVYADPASRSRRVGDARRARRGRPRRSRADASGFGLSVQRIRRHRPRRLLHGRRARSTSRRGRTARGRRQAVADAADPDATATGNAAPSTAVTVDASGTRLRRVGGQRHQALVRHRRLVRIRRRRATTVSTGSDPSLAASDNGVALSWYETTQQNQMIGFLGDLADVLVAQPSPSLTVSQGPPAGADVRQGRQGRSRRGRARTRLRRHAASSPPADQPFTINFDNQDASPAQHRDLRRTRRPRRRLITGEVGHRCRSRPRTTSRRWTPAPTSSTATSTRRRCSGTFAVVKGAK